MSKLDDRSEQTKKFTSCLLNKSEQPREQVRKNQQVELLAREPKKNKLDDSSAQFNELLILPYEHKWPNKTIGPNKSKS